MEASSLSTLVSPSVQFSGRSRHRSVRLCYRRTPQIAKVLAMKQDSNSDNSEFSGRVVDQNMLILRRRINQMKAADRSDETLEQWTEWEKQCYTLYQSEICEVLGLLNLNFTKTRPNLAIGVSMTVKLSVPTSVLVVMLHLMDAASIILNGIHVE